MDRPHKNDDLWCALECNTPGIFSIDDIKDIVAEVPGANDEYSWWWVLEMSSGFMLLEGSCDYTGWDCQSSITEFELRDTATKAAMDAPVVEEYSKRTIQPNLIAQLEGKYPKFAYWGKED